MLVINFTSNGSLALIYISFCTYRDFFIYVKIALNNFKDKEKLIINFIMFEKEIQSIFNFG